MKEETAAKISHWLWTTEGESRLTSILMCPLRFTVWVYNMFTSEEQP